MRNKFRLALAIAIPREKKQTDKIIHMPIQVTWYKLPNTNEEIQFQGMNLWRRGDDCPHPETEMCLTAEEENVSGELRPRHEHGSDYS